jgi:transcriptional regulator with XRE-family HTH domain
MLLQHHCLKATIIGIRQMSTSRQVDTRWFHNKLQDKQMSQRGLAKLLDLDPAAVSLMLKGRRKMSAAEAAEIANLLGVSVDEVLTRSGAGMPVKKSAAPVNFVQPLRDVQGGDADMLELPVPMSDGGTARLMIPRQLSKVDADRIASLLAAFAVK